MNFAKISIKKFTINKKLENETKGLIWILSLRGIIGCKLSWLSELLFVLLLINAKTLPRLPQPPPAPLLPHLLRNYLLWYFEDSTKPSTLLSRTVYLATFSKFDGGTIILVSFVAICGKRSISFNLGFKLYSAVNLISGWLKILSVSKERRVFLKIK